MLSITATIAAILVVLALAVVALAWAAVRTRRAVAPLAVALVNGAGPQQTRLVESLARTRLVASQANSSAERALWAVTGLDARAERVETTLRGHRHKLDETTSLIAGMGGRLERLRSVAALVLGR